MASPCRCHFHTLREAGAQREKIVSEKHRRCHSLALPRGGRIVSAPSDDFPAVFTRGQPDNKARILLMLALTRTKEPAALQRIFDTC